MKTSSISKESLNNMLIKALGINYEEFDRLDFDEQQRIISEYHKRNPKKEDKNVHIMIGNGENSAFIKVKKGEKVMIGSGEHSCFIEAGITQEESRRRLDDEIDDSIYCKPVALVKKISRRIKR